MKKTAMYPGLIMIFICLLISASGLFGQEAGDPEQAAVAPDTSVPKKNISKYIGQSKRDPFMSLLSIREEDRTKVLPPPPLEERPPGLPGLLISEVSVAGVATSNSKNIIVLKGIDGISYIAEPGSKLFDGVLNKVDNVGVTFTRTELSTDGKTKNYKVTKPFNSSEKQVLP